MFKLWWTKMKNLKNNFVVYNSNTPLTSKESQGHQIWHDLVDPKQAYNNTKFKKTHLNSVCGKANNKIFVK